MAEEYSKARIFYIAQLAEMISDGVLLLLLLIRLITIFKTGVFSRAQLKWTNLFFIKLLISILLALNYGSMSISINPFKHLQSMINNLLNSIVWLFASLLLYFEYLRQLNQSWFSLRFLYFIQSVNYISKVSLQAMYDSDHIHLFTAIVFGLLSLPMLICSIAFPNNSFEDKVGSFAQLNEITLNIFQNDNEDSTNSRDIIEISITENKAYTFHQQGDLLMPLNMKSKADASNIKLKFIVKILIPNTEDKYHHSAKKTIKSIVKFNQKCLANLDKNSEGKASYLPLHTEVCQNIQSISKALTQKDGMASSIVLSEKFKQLELNYTKLCQYKQFLIDFLGFLAFDNKEIIDNIVNCYSLLVDSKSQSELNNMSFASIKDNVDSNDLLNREEQVVIDTDNVISQLTLNEMMFINDIISKVNHLEFTIDEDYYINECINCKIRTETIALPIVMPIQQLYNYVNQFASKAKTRTKAKRVFIILSNEAYLGQIVNGTMKDDLKLELEELISQILNDVFYLNEASFELFHLDKIIKCDSSNSMIHQAPRVFFDERAIEMFQFAYQAPDFRKYTIECEIEQVQTVGTNLECEALVIISTLNASYKSSKCAWKAEVNLTELFKVLSEIAEMSSAYPILLSQLSLLLNQLKEMLSTFGISLSKNNSMKNWLHQKDNTKPNQSTNLSLSLSMDQHPNKQKMCYDLSTNIKSLFLLDKRQVLYSVSFRQMFSIDKIILSRDSHADNESLNCSMHSLI